jgi:hypothetical protein
VKITGEVHLDDGKYVQVAARAQENRGIRSSDACGEISVPSTEWCGRIIPPNLEAIWEMLNKKQKEKYQ